MATQDPELHRVVPRCLLTLHQKANGTELDGEGIQAQVEWGIEALRWKVTIEISQDELEELVDSSDVSPEEDHRLLQEDDRSESGTLGGAGTVLKPPETMSNGEKRA